MYDYYSYSASFQLNIKEDEKEYFCKRAEEIDFEHVLDYEDFDFED